jgi:hypothetical protein
VVGRAGSPAVDHSPRAESFSIGDGSFGDPPAQDEAGHQKLPPDPRTIFGPRRFP